MKVVAPPVELTDCDREPITRLERIQAFGFLLAIAPDWTVARASANLGSMLGLEAGHAIGLALDDVIDAEAVHDMRNRIVILRAHAGTERLYQMTLRPDREPFDVALHYSDGLFVIEGEPSGALDGSDAASMVRTMVARLNTMKTLADFHRDCARQVRALTGFSRVMIYRFADSGVGEVVAESINGSMPAFLGLHFPAADIPVQARALYLKNPFRIIGDVDQPTVALVPTASATTPVLDLSMSITRAVSPVHLEYLSNMGVSASLSISIVVEGKLWGLIACHHDQPAVPSFVKRSASELFAQMYSMILESRLHHSMAIEEARARTRADRMISMIAGDLQLLQRADWMHEVLREMIPCDGVAIVWRGRIEVSGTTPSPEAVASIINELKGFPVANVFATDTLAVLPFAVADPSTATAGMMSIPLSLMPRDYILMFRDERVHERVWGGDPRNKAVADDPAMRVSPRKSFAAYSQWIRGRSASFTVDAHRTAEIVRTALTDIVFKLADESGDQRDRATERQELLIAELNHRVRNILALIRGLINQTMTGDTDVADYVQSLNGRVQALARAHDQVTSENYGPALLSSLFDHEIGAYVPTQRDRFVVGGPPVYLLPQAFSTMALVIHELVTNSLKYGALSDSGRVRVDIAHAPGEGLNVTWQELDGPPVAPPTRRGFGSAIIERTIPFDLQGTTSVRYLPAGLEVDFFIPERFLWLDHVPTPPMVTIVRNVPGRPLEGMNVLLLEDNMIIALETEDLLRELGAAHVQAVSTIASAYLALEHRSIDFAVLDVNVGTETSLELGSRCSERSIPLIFASGYGNASPGDRDRTIPMVNKPYLLQDVARAIERALDAHRTRRPSPSVDAEPIVDIEA